MKTKMKLVSIMVLLTMLFASNVSYAQVFILANEEDVNYRIDATEGGGFIIPESPTHDTTGDYTPLGSGIWVLGCLGAAYALRRKRKEE